MQYLVFGALLILGAAVVGLSLYISHRKNCVCVNVVDSRFDMDFDEKSIKSIRIIHILEFEVAGETRRIETDIIPVREIKGAKLKLYYNKEKESLYRPEFSRYIAYVFAFMTSGIFCFALYFLYNVQDMALFDRISADEWFIAFLALIVLTAFLHMDVLLNPSIIKTKGNYEGVIYSEDGNIEEVYSLWYGEHRQYTTRVKGMKIKNDNKKTVVLFYNTKTGVAKRIHELIISVCVGTIALAVMIAFIVI